MFLLRCPKAINCMDLRLHEARLGDRILAKKPADTMRRWNLKGRALMISAPLVKTSGSKEAVAEVLSLTARPTRMFQVPRSSSIGL